MKKLLLILLCFPMIGSTQNIGDYYQGGIVFYLNGNGGGLVAAPSDLANYYRGGCGYLGTTGTLIGTGSQNTIDIVALCSTNSTGPDTAAAVICANSTLAGYNDWFLPSLMELKEMYLSIGQGSPLGNVGGFDDFGGNQSIYWSSSDFSNCGDDGEGWMVDFSQNGETNSSQNIHKYSVRPIRCINNDCSSLTPSAIQEHTTNKELLKVTDLLGRETKQTNQPLFYIYDDGTVEKRIVIE
jgi:hypothetical protein